MHWASSGSGSSWERRRTIPLMGPLAAWEHRNKRGARTPACRVHTLQKLLRSRLIGKEGFMRVSLFSPGPNLAERPCERGTAVVVGDICVRSERFHGPHIPVHRAACGRSVALAWRPCQLSLSADPAWCESAETVLPDSCRFASVWLPPSAKR